MTRRRHAPFTTVFLPRQNAIDAAPLDRDAEPLAHQFHQFSRTRRRPLCLGQAQRLDNVGVELVCPAWSGASGNERRHAAQREGALRGVKRGARQTEPGCRGADGHALFAQPGGRAPGGAARRPGAGPDPLRAAPRRLTKGLSISFEGDAYQVTGHGRDHRLRGASVTVCKGYDGTVTVLRDGRELPVRLLGEGGEPPPVEGGKTVRSRVDLATAAQRSRLNWKPAPERRNPKTSQRGHFCFAGKGTFLLGVDTR